MLLLLICNCFIKERKNMKYWKWNEYEIAKCDVLDYLKTLNNESIDLIIADPPYFQVYGKFDFTFKSEKEYIEWCKKWLLECKRVLKDTGTLILYGSLGKRQITFARLAVMIEDEEMFLRQNWITQRNTRGIGTKTNYMSAREDILFLTKTKNYTFNIPYLEEKSERKDLGSNGKPRKNKFKRVSNVWYDIAEASQSSIERCEHPTVKAQKLCDRIIQTHSNENDIVLIPFLGSGSEMISAIKNNRKAIGCEIDEKYVILALERVKRMAGADFYEMEKNKE